MSIPLDTPESFQPELPGARKPRTVTRKQFVIGSAVAVLLIAGISVGAVELTTPHYKQAWCSTVIPLIDGQTVHTESDYENALASAGAPVSQLLTDIQTYQADNASMMNADAITGVNMMGTVATDLSTVGSDLRQIDRECGVPVSAAAHQEI